MVGTGSGWKDFWNRGGWWRALLLVVVYAVVYQGLGFLVNALFGDVVDRDNVLATPASVLVGVALPIVLASGVLLLFGRTLGWLPELFGRQPVAGKRWMWLAVVLVVVPVVLRLASTEWSSYSVALVLSMLLMGLAVGFAEELLTRGFVVDLLRRGGSSERVVLVLSSLYFALLHAGNVLSGQPVLTVAVTVVYTFGFGAMMYLSLLVTGRLVWAILLHAATDPTTMLATGAIDGHSSTIGGDAALLSFAGIFNVIYVVVALVAIFLVKGRARVDQKV